MPGNDPQSGFTQEEWMNSNAASSMGIEPQNPPATNETIRNAVNRQTDPFKHQMAAEEHDVQSQQQSQPGQMPQNVGQKRISKSSGGQPPQQPQQGFQVPDVHPLVAWLFGALKNPDVAQAESGIVGAASMAMGTPPAASHPLQTPESVWNGAKAIGRLWYGMSNPDSIKGDMHWLEGSQEDHNRSTLNQAMHGLINPLGLPDDLVANAVSIAANLNPFAGSAYLMGLFQQPGALTPGNVAGQTPPGQVVQLAAMGPQNPIQNPGYYANLAWAGFGTALLAGAAKTHLLGPMERLLPGWAKVARTLDQHMAQRDIELRQPPHPPVSFEDAAKKAQEAAAAGVEPVAVVKKGGKPFGALPTGEVGEKALPKPIQAAVQANELSDKQVEYIKKNWSKYFSYDLRRANPADVYYGAPSDYIADIADPKQRYRAQALIGKTNAYLAHLMAGPFAEHGDQLFGSLFRSIMAAHRGTAKWHNDWTQSLEDMFKGMGGTVRDVGMRRAMEGDTKAFDGLAPEEKMAVSAAKLLYASHRDVSAAWGTRKDFVPNYFPSLPIDREGRPLAQGYQPTPLINERKAHRSETFTTNEKGQLQLTQRNPTVDARNQSQAFKRNRLAGDLQQQGLTPDEAQSQAQVSHPDYSGNFRQVIYHDLHQRVQGLHSQQAFTVLSDSIMRSGAAEMPLAYRGADEAMLNVLKEHGYRTADAPGYQGVQWHPAFADAIDEAAKASDLTGPRWFRKMLEINSRAIQAVMYNPLIHNANIARRLGWLTATHPLVALPEIMKQMGVALSPIEKRLTGSSAQDYYSSLLKRQDYFDKLRSDAYHWGVMPHMPRDMNAAEMSKAMAWTSGDRELANAGPTQLSDIPKTLKDSPVKAGLGRVGDLYHAAQNNLLWSRVNDFGVLTFHVFKQLAERDHPELSTEISRNLWAGDMANAWMGHVRPERWNPALKAGMQSALFAPNWWRSYFQVMTGAYDKQGIIMTPALRSTMVKNEMKTLLAGAGMQKLTGNLLNHAVSGHWQFQNLPGNQDRIELGTQQEPPAEIQAELQTYYGLPDTQRAQYYQDHPAMANWLTGAVKVMDNPFADKQLFALEQAGGLESGQSGWSVPQAEQGFLRSLSNRLSPLANFLAAAANIDLRQSVRNGNLQKIDPNGPSLDSVIIAASKLTPLDYTMGTDIERGGPGPTGLVGQAVQNPQQTITHLPDALKKYADPANIALGLVGIAPPWESSPKSPGAALTQDEWLKVKEEGQKHTDLMASLSKQALVDLTLAPADWLKAYQDENKRYSGFLQAMYEHAPYYTQGAEGLWHDYNDLFRQATDPNTGELDTGVLADLQKTFESQHSSDQMAAVTQEQTKAELNAPMIKLYHDTVGSLHSMQDQFAQSIGMNADQLRQEVSAYGKSYGNQQASAEYVGQHPEVQQYEGWKRQWETNTIAGLLYSMFYNIPSVQNWLQQQGISTGQLVQGAEQVEQQAAGQTQSAAAVTP